jgi:hypothetical protein
MKKIATWSLIVALSAVWPIHSAWAQEATPTPQPSPPPEPFTIEGLHIGMTLGEAEAAGVDIREAKHLVRDDQRGLLYRIRTDDKTIAEAILDADGKIRTITVSYITTNIAGGLLLGPRAPSFRPILPFSSLIAVLAERWGPPVDTTSEEKLLHEEYGLGTASGLTVASGQTQIASWVKGKQSAVVVSTQVPGPLGDVMPVLSLCIGRDQTPAELVAALLQPTVVTPRARDKVKF